MPETFSSDVKIWLEKQHILAATENHFRHEWEAILTEVRRQLSKEGWDFRCDGEPPHEEIKIRRPHWPDGICGVHYEMRAQDRFRKQGIADLGLHVEQDVPQHEVVAQRLRQLLSPFAGYLLSSLAEVAPALPTSPPEKVIRGQLPLANISVETICRVLHELTATESFVDEAVLLAGKETIWRSDLTGGKEMPQTEAHWWKDYPTATGPAGGWELDKESGRCGSPCLICRPGKSNHRDGWNILNLQKSGYPFQFPPGERVYFAVTARSDMEFEMEFILEANSTGAWKHAFDGPFKIGRANHWQVIFREGMIPEIPGYDMSSQGLDGHVRVNAVHAPIQIDSIEVGRS